MKKNIFLLFTITLSSMVFSQVKIDRYNWDSQVAFKNSGVPYEKTYGPLSDSLRTATADGLTQFYFYDNEYYAINSWADYFLWYSKKYSWKFIEGTHAYEYYHLTNNNEEMMRFVFENSQISTNYSFASSATFTPLTNRRRYDEPVLFERKITSVSSTNSNSTQSSDSKKVKFKKPVDKNSVKTKD